MRDEGNFIGEVSRGRGGGQLELVYRFKMRCGVPKEEPQPGKTGEKKGFRTNYVTDFDTIVHKKWYWESKYDEGSRMYVSIKHTD